jgi:hypothetical protein
VGTYRKTGRREVGRQARATKSPKSSRLPVFLRHTHGFDADISLRVSRRAGGPARRLERRRLAPPPVSLRLRRRAGEDGRGELLEEGASRRRGASRRAITSRDGRAAPPRIAITSRNGRAARSRKAITSRDGRAAPSRKAITSRDGRAARSRKAITSRDGRAAPSRKAITSRDGRAAPSRKAVTSRDDGAPAQDARLPWRPPRLGDPSPSAAEGAPVFQRNAATPRRDTPEMFS